MTQLGEKIRQIRKLKKMTQLVFAEKLGVTRAHISKIERGRTSLSNQLIKSICREYKVNEKWLRYDEGPVFIDQLCENTQKPLQTEVGHTDPAILELVKIINRKDKEIARVKRRLTAYDKLIPFLEGRIDMLEEKLREARHQNIEGHFEASKKERKM